MKGDLEFRRIFNLKCIIALICVISMLTSAIPNFFVNASNQPLLRPVLTGNGNYTVIGANEEADVKFTSYGDGVSSNLPTLTGDFTSIPDNAKAIVFYFDFTDAVNTGVASPCFEILFYTNNKCVWRVNRSVASGNIITNKATEFTMYYANNDGFFKKTFEEPQKNRKTPLEPVAGTTGYVVIPITEDVLSNAISGGLDLSKITSIRFNNLERSKGKDFQEKKGYIRDLGYITDLELFEADCRSALDSSNIINKISNLKYPPTLADATEIQNIRNAYDNFFFKDRITNYDRLVLIENAFGKLSEYESVIDAINAIGIVDENSYDLIRNAMDAYLSLDSSYKEMVTNYEILNVAVAEFYNIVSVSYLEDQLQDLPNEATYDNATDVELIRIGYNNLKTKDKISFSAYDKLLQLELSIEKWNDPVYYGDGNYVVINKNENANVTFGESAYQGITQDLPTLKGNLGVVPEDAQAIAFYFDYTDAVQKGSIPPMFNILFSNDAGAVWNVSGSKGSALQICSISSNGYTQSKASAPGSYRPSAGQMGYVLIPINEEILSNAVENGLDLSTITKITFKNTEWVYGADFRRATVSLRDLGYVKNIEEFKNSFKTSVDFSALSGAVEVLSSVTTIEDKVLIDECANIYNSILPSARVLVNNYEKFLQAQLNYERVLDVDGAIAAINAIGEVTSDSFDLVEDAILRYSSLDDSLKNKVTNYSVLESAKKKLYSVLNSETVSNIIAGLGDDVTRADYTKFILLRDCYNSLTPLEREKVVGIESFEEKESRLNQIMPMYNYAPNNYVVLNQNPNATMKFTNKLGNGASQSLPTIYGDCAFVPKTAEAIAFWFDFSQAQPAEGLPNLFQSVSLCDGAKTLFSNLKFRTYTMNGDKFVKSYGSNTWNGVPGTVGYFVIPITAELLQKVDLSKVDNIKFHNMDWLYGTGFGGATVHFRNVGYIYNLYDFEHAMRRMNLEGYLVELQPEGTLKMNLDVVSGDMVTVSWENHSDAYNYAVTVYDANKNFYSGEIYRRVNQGDVYKLQLSTDYYIQVAALDKNGKVIAYSNSEKFTTLEKNIEKFTAELIEADDINTSGYLIEGTSVSVFWENIDGVEYYSMNLYTEDEDGKLTYIYSERKAGEPYQITFLLLDSTKNYVAQLVAYDFSDSIIFAYQPDRFTLSSESTYISPDDNINDDEDEIPIDVSNGKYVTEIVQETVFETVMVDKEVAGKGKWVRQYDWILNKEAVYIYIAIGAVGILLISGGVITFVILKRKKKKERKLR